MVEGRVCGRSGDVIVVVLVREGVGVAVGMGILVVGPKDAIAAAEPDDPSGAEGFYGLGGEQCRGRAALVFDLGLVEQADLCEDGTAADFVHGCEGAGVY